MPRYTSRMALVAKVETTPGVDITPSAATDGVLIVKGVDITPLEATYAERNLQLPWFGGSQNLLASFGAKISFEVEFGGGGSAALATTGAAWGPLLQACGMAQSALTTPTRVEHTPVSTGLKTASIYLMDDGVLHKLIGAMGNCKLSAKKGQVPRYKFDFIGTYATVTAVAFPAAASIPMTAWKVPVPVSKAYVGAAADITLGCTYAAGALTGGTVFPSTGLEIDLGNQLQWVTTLSAERAEVTDHAMTCSFELELTAAQEVTAYSDMILNTTAGLGFTLGTGTGVKLMLFAPQLRRTAIKKADMNGIRTLAFDGVLLPSVGDDDLRIIQL